jgi:hypothetical protein
MNVLLPYHVPTNNVIMFFCDCVFIQFSLGVLILNCIMCEIAQIIMTHFDEHYGGERRYRQQYITCMDRCRLIEKGMFPFCFEYV